MAYAKKDDFDYEKYLEQNRTQTLFKEFGQNWDNNPRYKDCEDIIIELYDSNPLYIAKKVEKLIIDNEIYKGKQNGFGRTAGALMVSHKYFDKEIELFRKTKDKKQKEIKQIADDVRNGGRCPDDFEFNVKVDFGEIPIIHNNYSQEKERPVPHSIKKLGNNMNTNRR